jgi:hypothetical protein
MLSLLLSLGQQLIEMWFTKQRPSHLCGRKRELPTPRLCDRREDMCYRMFISIVTPIIGSSALEGEVNMGSR